MVKQAFTDPELNKELFLTSANSINVARWLPQQFYYFFALAQWKEEAPPVICVSSGNFGNICAGLLAHVSGMPASHFIAACNSNDVFTQYIASGEFNARDAQATISNAMDVGNPSNFVRILELFNQDYPSIANLISSYMISDEETRKTIAEVYRQHHYLTDPHGAVGYAALDRYLQEHPGGKGFFLETAHPVKFSNVVEEVIEHSIEFPETMQHLLQAEKKSHKIKAEFGELKGYLKNR